MDSSPVSSQFNAEDADIHFKSSDNVLFFIHRENLKCCAAGFPPLEFKPVKGEVVPLTESAQILELLFTFVYPNPVPDVKKMPFGTLSDLADAAEKYRVFSAMAICCIYMTAAVSDHPVEVLRYAVIHRYVELVDSAGPLALGKGTELVALSLPTNAVVAWVQYYLKWQSILADEVYNPKRSNRCCCSWDVVYVRIWERFGGKVESLCTLEEVFSIDAKGDVCCSRHLSSWRDQVFNACNRLPKLSTYMFPNPPT